MDHVIADSSTYARYCISPGQALQSPSSVQTPTYANERKEQLHGVWGNIPASFLNDEDLVSPEIHVFSDIYKINWSDFIDSLQLYKLKENQPGLVYSEWRDGVNGKIADKEDGSPLGRCPQMTISKLDFQIGKRTHHFQ